VAQLCKCLLILMKPRSEITWEAACRMLCQPTSFLMRLRFFAEGGVTSAQVTDIKALIARNNLTSTRVKQVSVASVGLMYFVEAVVAYHDAKCAYHDAQVHLAPTPKVPELHEEPEIVEVEAPRVPEIVAEVETPRDAATCLLDARAGLCSICKNDITELKAFAKPPSGVVHVVNCVAALLEPDAALTWETGKRMLGDASFLSRLVNWNLPQGTTAAQVAIVKTLIARHNLTATHLKPVSLAAAGLFQFVEAVVACHDAGLLQACNVASAEPATAPTVEVKTGVHEPRKTHTCLKLVIAELRALPSPPAGVKRVVEMVGLALNVEPDWGSMKAEMDRRDFMKKLRCLKGDAATRARMPHGELCPKSVSLAGHTLEQWVRSTLHEESYVLLEPEPLIEIDLGEELATAAGAVSGLDYSLALEPVRGVAKAIGVTEVAAFDVSALPAEKAEILARLVHDPTFIIAAMKGQSKVTALLADWMVKLTQYLSQ